MTQDPKNEPDGASTIASLLSPRNLVIAQLLFRVARKANASYQQERRQQAVQNDLIRRQAGEIFMRMAQPRAPTSEPAGGRATRPPSDASEDSGVRAELDEIAAERARLKKEKELFRARQALARERVELEQLRRQTEGMEAAVVDLQEGRRPPAEVLAEVIEGEEDGPEIPAEPPEAITEAQTSSPPTNADVQPEVDKDEARAVDAYNLAGAALRSENFAVALAHADHALEAVKTLLTRRPDRTGEFHHLRHLLLFMAAKCCVETNTLVRAVFLADDALKAAKDALPQATGLYRETLVHSYARTLVTKGDAKLKLARVDEAVELYEEARSRLREIAAQAPNQAVLDDLAFLGYKLDGIPRHRQH